MAGNPYKEIPLKQAWKEGYSAITDVNPYKTIKELSLAWREGFDAKKDDIKLIPPGCYCYFGSRAPGDLNYRPCPFWSVKNSGDITLGSCSFMNVSDTEEEDLLLWEQVKLCGENDF